MGDGERRRRAERAGRWAEAASAVALRLRGYRILARGYRCAVGEVDIVARRGAVLAFVEVKARATRAAALQALSARQRRRIERAAEAWLAMRPERWPEPLGPTIRFDMMLVAPWRWPRHVPNAWQRDGRR